MPAKLPPGEAARRKAVRFKAWRLRNLDDQKAKRRVWYQAQPKEEIAASAKESYRRRRSREAGRPPPEHCECCGRRAKLIFDHDHASGAFRGWICAKCNTGIGLLGDSIKGLRIALLYLQKVEEGLCSTSR